MRLDSGRKWWCAGTLMLALGAAAVASGQEAGGTIVKRGALAGDLYLAGQRIDVLADVHGDLVAAERVPPLGMSGGIGNLPEVPGCPVVVQDDVLVQLAHRGHQPNSSRARWRPRTSASASASVL